MQMTPPARTKHREAHADLSHATEGDTVYTVLPAIGGQEGGLLAFLRHPSIGFGAC